MQWSVCLSTEGESRGRCQRVGGHRDLPRPLHFPYLRPQSSMARSLDFSMQKPSPCFTRVQYISDALHWTQVLRSGRTCAYPYLRVCTLCPIRVYVYLCFRKYLYVCSMVQSNVTRIPLSLIPFFIFSGLTVSRVSCVSQAQGTAGQVARRRRWTCVLLLIVHPQHSCIGQ